MRDTTSPLTTAAAVRQEVIKLVKLGRSYKEICRALSMRCNEMYQGDVQLYEKDILDFCHAYSSFSQIQLLQDKKILRVDGKSYIYDPITKSKKPFVLQDFKDVVHPDFLQERYMPCFPTYEPHNKQDIIHRNGEMLFNVYVPPAWRAANFYHDERIDECTLPVEYANFFDHLFAGDIQSIEHNIRWIAHSLKSRNLTYNTLIGAEGAGKGVHDLIMQQLHGPTNCGKIRGETFLNSRFNGDMKNKTYYYIDEAALMTNAAEDRFKDLVNDTVLIEEKGVDARLYSNYVNVVISSNNYNSIKLKEGQRRFNVLEMASSNLRTNSHFNTDDKIKRLFLDEQLISQLGRYLWHLQYNEQTLATPFLGSKNHRRILDSALADWENHMITRLCRQFAGKQVFSRHIIQLIGNELDNVRVRPTHARLDELAGRYRGFFRATRYEKGDIHVPDDFKHEPKSVDNDYSQVIIFSELADMPFDKYFLKGD